MPRYGFVMFLGVGWDAWGDWLTVLFAGLALVVSWRAYVIAKDAPTRERLNATRDGIRSTLTSAVSYLDEMRRAMRAGEAPNQRPGKLDDLYDQLTVLGPRVPEHRAVQDLAARLVIVASKMSSYEVKLSQVMAASWIIEVGEGDRADNESHKQKLQRHENARDTAKNELSESITTARETLQSHIDQMDARDRKTK